MDDGFVGKKTLATTDTGVGGGSVLTKDTGVGSSKTLTKEVGVGSSKTLTTKEVGVGSSKILTKDTGVGSEKTLTKEVGVGSKKTLTKDTGVGSEKTLTKDTGVGSEKTLTKDTGVGSDKTLTKTLTKNIGDSTDIAPTTTTDVAVGGDDEILVTHEVVEEIRARSEAALREKIRELTEELERESENVGIPPNDLREITSVLRATSIAKDWQTIEESMEELDVEIEYWEDRANGADTEVKKGFYRSVAEVAKLTKDFIKVKNSLKPETEVGVRAVDVAIEGSDELRLERFKRWAKENITSISAVAISTAGLITGIVSAARSVLTTVAGGLGKFVVAVAKVLKKLGPLFAAVGSLISTALSWGARGILWMASNLWFLVVVVLASLYAEYGRRKSVK